MEFCKRLEQLLEDEDLTQRRVSTDLHIAPTTLNGYIRGNREPDYGTLIRIADYFHVSIDYLLGLSNVRTRETLPLSVEEGDLVGVYRSLEPENQALLRDQAYLYRKYDQRKKAEKEQRGSRDHNRRRRSQEGR